MKLKIMRYSHHYVVSNHTWMSPSIMREYLRRFLFTTTFKDIYGKTHEQDRRMFAASNAQRTYYRLHINTFNDFMDYLAICGVPKSSIEITDEPLYEGNPSGLRMQPKFTPKEAQVPLIEFFVNPDPPIKLCKLQTGGGKTFCALSASARLQKLFVLIVRPKYIQNWEVALYGKERVTTVESERVKIVQGGKDLTNLIHEALTTDGPLPYDFIIISNRTYANYIDEYEEYGNLDDTYGCNPVDFMKTVGAHCLLRDEVHLDFHLNFRIDLYTHVPMSISLSATFSSADLMLARMQALQYPPSSHAPAQVHNRYVHVKALRFSLGNIRNFKWALRGRTDYNHIAFEKSILKNRASTERWLGLIQMIVQQEYIDRRVPGTRYIVTASSTEMVRAIADHLASVFGTFSVAEYIQGSDFLKIKECDIVVTTVMSGTAAIDIKGLIGGLMTTAIGSETTNLQAIGRIRVLNEYPDMPLRFCYLYNHEIPQSLKYHVAKKELFKSRVLSHVELPTDVTL